MTINAKKCPICNQENRCGNESGEERCWCSKEFFPEGIFKLIPKEMRNKVCICQNCLVKYSKNSPEKL